MSTLPKNTIATSNAAEKMETNDEIASNSSNRSEKRPLDETMDDQAKKIKVETPILKQEASMCFATNNSAAPGFVNAATMVGPISEISDEDLLAYTLEFERKHGI